MKTIVSGRPAVYFCCAENQLILSWVRRLRTYEHSKEHAAKFLMVDAVRLA